MSDENILIQKRFSELHRRAESTNVYFFSHFLSLAEQSLFRQLSLPPSTYTAFGGREGCERIMVRFGNEEEIGYELPFPIVLLKAEPVSQKYADKLSHRDLLGALMNLGIEREVLGDIVLRDNVGYIFAEETIAPFLIESFTRVKHTDIRLSVVDTLPEGELFQTEAQTVQISSERLDAIVARVYSLSRDDAQALFKKSLVYAEGRVIESPSYRPHEDERISVRGYGRFVYRGVRSTSKKGKLNVLIEKFV